MTLLSLILPTLILAAWWLERRERTAEHGRLLAAQERERDQWYRERQLLLNRIKPETAQYVAEPGPVVVPSAPGFDDDDAFWKATESREDLADRMLREELAANTTGEGD